MSLSDQEHRALILLAQRNGCNSCYISGKNWAEIFRHFFNCHICISGNVRHHIDVYEEHGREHLKTIGLGAFI
jgi:hypothetical protein